MVTSVRGDSREGRKLSAAIFIPLSVLFLVLNTIYGEPKDSVAGILMLGLSLILLTRLWWVFYPVVFLSGGSLVLWRGFVHADWLSVGIGVLMLLMGLVSGFEKLRNPQER